MAKKSTSSNKKRLVKVEAVGQAHVHSSFFDQFYWSGDFMVFRRKDGFQRI